MYIWDSDVYLSCLRRLALSRSGSQHSMGDQSRISLCFHTDISNEDHHKFNTGFSNGPISAHPVLFDSADSEGAAPEQYEHR
jgi:hypothetical protein